MTDSLDAHADSAERLSDELMRLDIRLETPLNALRMRFGLSELEVRCLLAAIGPHISREYDKLYSYLQDDYTSPYLSIDLLLQIGGEDEFERREILERMTADSPFVRDFWLARFPLGSASTPSLPSREFRLQDRMVHFFLGLEWREHGPLKRARWYPDPGEGLGPSLLNEDLERRAIEFARQRRGQASSTVMFVYGPSGSGKTHLARRTAEALGSALLEWDLRNAPEEESPFIEAVDRLLFEAKLQDAIPAFDHLHTLQRPQTESTGRDRRLEWLLERLDACGQLIFLTSEEEIKLGIPPGSMVDIPIPLETPDLGERVKLWQTMATGPLSLTQEEAGALAAKFQFTPGKIKATVEEVLKSADWRRLSEARNDDSDNSSKLLHKAAYRLISHHLKEKAVKMEPRFGWEDLILPPETTQLLRQACDRVKLRHKVLHEWGFEGKLPYGKGISMLFTGPPGTGKTMSAMVMAKEMDAELYRVDLSRVVSKYIGETEKNLSEIFDQAKLSGAILFFDEADALFGKRSEVKDSHDKHANMETSYLLQKMEEYDGLTILATNFAQNLDDAFTRRIPFIVKYPFPDAVQREQLWRATFPKKLPVEFIDYAFLSQAFELAGGPIKNIVVTAAFLAAKEGVPVSMKQVIEGVVQEYKKTGKVLLKDRLGAYADFWKG
ncbi:AAA family ATPase [Cohnella sp. AR92]|uniref:AAA family ATPase n=1 Tax=Cohnella sp. AR92 TaxID=648716 RepID=UPI000F8EA898|nr:AAA family ATPase [Cohnella sp. AR92]RUS45908.1 AAA family ATPase [Cohnella sp. AR92]